MQLIKAKVSGYKRLADDCELNLDADPVCIVGPNAAGKSSFLDALVHLNHAEPFDQTERTRVPGGRTLDPAIEARFLLNAEERALLEDIPEASEVRQFLVIKRADAQGLRYNADPYPHRDMSKRHEVLDKLEQLKENSWAEQAQRVEEGLEDPPDPLIETLFARGLELAVSKDEKIHERTGELTALADRIEFIRDQRKTKLDLEGTGGDSNASDWPALPEGTADLPNDLRVLAAQEQEDHPLRRVMNKLSDRVPRFLKFNDLARKLEAEYDLNGEEPAAEAAIHNFLALAGTSWAEALEVVQRGDKGWKKTYLEDIDNRLKNRAALVWGQSDIEVKVDLDGSLLTILLSMEAHDFIDLEQHSDGLQQFMSLRAFVWRAEQEIKPIVLIDEADLHLHYDAQADLVGVFEEQKEAQQIIYTTHSAGCLPHDLGLGIRAIVPETEEVEDKSVQKDHSRTVNRFWTEGRGFSPLLLAMGAGAFAFSATQWAVVTEGMSDALLLPTLLREATGEARLHYQAVPGFSEATSDEIARFDLVAGRVAFLADGDEGGRKNVERLTDSGIAVEQILFLGNDADSGLSIEDLLDETIYLAAVNQELRAWHGVEFPASELPTIGRSNKVKAWCAERTGRAGAKIALSKVDVAQRVLDQRSSTQSLVATDQRQSLVELHTRIKGVFEGAPTRMKRMLKEAREAFEANRESP